MTCNNINWTCAYRADETVPPGQRLLLDYGAYVTYSYLSVDDRTGNNHGLREGDLFAYVRANLDGAQEFFARTRIGFRDFNRGDNFDAPNNYQSIGFDLDRGYYRLDLARYNAAYGKNVLGMDGTDGNVVFEGGRDLVYWANGLVLAEVIDGVMVDLSRGGLDLQIIAGVTPVRTVDFDTSRPAFYYNTRRGFFGGMISEQVGTVRPFCLRARPARLQHRQRPRPKARSIPASATTATTSAPGASGPLGDRLRYSVEAVYRGRQHSLQQLHAQPTGRAASRSADARPDRRLRRRRPSRLRFRQYAPVPPGAELILASGDSDRGNSSTTFNGNTPRHQGLRL